MNPYIVRKIQIILDTFRENTLSFFLGSTYGTVSSYPLPDPVMIFVLAGEISGDLPGAVRAVAVRRLGGEGPLLSLSLWNPLFSTETLRDFFTTTYSETKSLEKQKFLFLLLSFIFFSFVHSQH